MDRGDWQATVHEVTAAAAAAAKSLQSRPTLCNPMGFRGGSAGKESACNMGDLDSIPGLGRSPGEGTGYPL